MTDQSESVILCEGYHMAGWYGENGCDDFYHAVWRDPAIEAQLEERLRTAGAWRVAEELVAE